MNTTCPFTAKEPERDCESQRLGAALDISDRQWRALVENALDGVLLSEPEGRILAANPAACRMLGRSVPELLALSRLDLFWRGDPRLSALIAEREERGFYRGELLLLRPDGSRFEAEVSSVVFFTPQGTVVSNIFHDISPRKAAEARVREQAEWLDKANDGIFVTDAEHRITYWNRGAERMIGWSAVEVVGKTVADLLALVNVPDPKVVEAAGNLTDWWGTLRCRHRDGTLLVIASSASVLRTPDGEPSGRLCICSDITEQARLREQFERAQRLQSIGLLAAGVVHDLNNILTPIRLAVPMIRPRLQQAEDLHLLDTVQACVNRGAAVIRRILGFAQGMGNEVPPLDLRLVVTEVAEIVSETFPRTITLHEDIGTELRPVLANPTQIHQLVLNLCVNARDAMPGGGRLRLGVHNCELDEAAAARIEGGRAGAHVVLTVEDSGSGIAPEVLAHVWEPFFTTKPAEGGTGLGLASVRSIVESHAGFVAVETAPGCGTRFRVFLPAVSSPVSRPRAEPRADSPMSGHGETILIVDDEPIVRDVTAALLSRAGYRIVTAANGREALALVQVQPTRFQLVLTDIDMPEMDGAQLASALLGISPALPVVAMTGLNSGSSRIPPERFAAGILPKPFMADALLGAVRQALSPQN